MRAVTPYFLCPSCGSGGPCPGHISVATRAVRSTQVTRWPLLDGDSVGRPFQTLPGKAKDRLCAVAPYFPCLGCGSGGPCPGHVPLTGRRFVGQGVSYQPGPCPAARLSALNRGKGEDFPPVLSPSFNRCRSSFLLFAKSVRVSRRFLGERRVERGRGELTDSFINLRCDVELEAIQHG